MATVTTHCDCGAQENNVCHCFHYFPIYLLWSDQTRCLDLCFWMLSFKPTFSLSSFIFIKRRFRPPSQRWQRNMTGRPLSPPQIHQKIIWTLSKFHKTTSEHWQRTPGTQKGSPLSLKGGRTKYKRLRDTKELGTETYPGEGAVKKLPNTRKLFHQQVCGEFWNLRGQHNQEEKNK